MKLNSRAVAIALPVGYLPISRNALVMQSGGGGGVEERASVEGALTLQGCPICLESLVIQNIADRPAALDSFGSLLAMLNLRQGQGEGAAKEAGTLHCKIQGGPPKLGHQDK